MINRGFDQQRDGKVGPPELPGGGLQPLPGNNDRDTAPTPTPLNPGSDLSDNTQGPDAGGRQNIPPKSGPQLSVEVVDGPRRETLVGQPLEYLIEVRNNSNTYPARDVTVSVPKSETLLYRGGRPEGDPKPTFVEWRIRDIKPGGRSQIGTSFTRLVPGDFGFGATVSTPEMQTSRASQPWPTRVTGSTVAITALGADPATPVVGEPFKYFFRIQNKLPVPHPIEIVVRDWDTQGIVPRDMDPQDSMVREVRLGAGEVRDFDVDVRGVTPGSHGFRVIADPQFGSAVASEARVRVRPGATSTIDRATSAVDWATGTAD